MTNTGPETPAEGGREEWDPAVDPDGYAREDVAPKDWYLDTVLNFVHGMDDSHEGSVALTVQSDGAVVSGQAISRKEWIERITRQYDQAGAAETGKHIDNLFNLMHTRAVTKHGERVAAGLPTAARRFLHMKDAHITHGSSEIVLPLWRGKLEDISGWSLGSVSS